MPQKLTNQYVILAKDVSTDSVDNSVSLIKIVDKVDIGIPTDGYKTLTDDSESVVSFPISTTVASCFGVDSFAERDIVFDVTLIMTSPLGKELINHTQNGITIKKGTDKSRINMNLQGLPVDASGRYSFLVTASQNGKELATGSTSLEVNTFEQNQ